MTWFQDSISKIASALQTDTQTGLNRQQVTDRQAQGLNELASVAQTPWIWMLLYQFKNPLLIILIFGALLSFVTQHTTDAIAISVIVALNALISFTQEYKAQKSMDALKQMAAPQAKVLREGEWQMIPAKQLVVGDIIKLDAGSIVPADCRLFHSQALRIDEAALTGESEPVLKDAETPIDDHELPIADQHNMAFMSSLVTEGQGSALVVNIGMQTEVGKIAGLLQSAETQLTPLQQRIHKLSKVLIIAAVLLVLMVMSVGLFHGMDWQTLMTTGISLTVAATPEGLITLLTIVLTLGASRMMQNHALVRQLASVETLGSTSVICSDKTGTLTQNKMQVTQFWTGGHFYHVTGHGYEPEGDFFDHQKAPIAYQDIEHLQHLAKISVVCSDAELKCHPEHKTHHILGSPTEGAILVAAAKAGVTRKAVNEQFELIQMFAFDAKRKMMSVIAQDKDGQYWLFAKGAPDIFVQHCEAVQLQNTLGDRLTEQANINSVIEHFANQALRTLAVGYRKLSKQELELPIEQLEDNLILSGIYGIIDPPRPEAVQAIQDCHSAGIRVVMITGDHASTARAIAHSMGIIQNPQAPLLEGSQLSQLSDEDLFKQVSKVSVYARVTPEHKLRIVQALQAHRWVVAMTGDGVNDAPALRKADIGVAMGITGTGVSKESADLILLDDNFASIVQAVKEGRRIYDNIRKFIRQDLTTNVGEVSALLFAFIFMVSGEPLLTLAPLMILWVNLVSDGLPSLALGVDGAESNVMARRPRPKDESFFANKLGYTILIRGLIMGAVTYGMFEYGLHLTQNVSYAQTLAFMTLIFGQLVQVFDSRTLTNIYRRNPFGNKALLLAVGSSAILSLLMVYLPFGNLFLSTTPLALEHLGLALMVGALPVLLVSALNDFLKMDWL
ncbi:cation-translocating P-type ATPase [Thiosulfativibrio zosterae]|uniref:Calcium-translocating P-type ATPase, SERCA-type n=1 Tax=Thiosulfativibrio zosterae TaxID=2675053 RepID=A0A6F8PKA3_9GAMM|nr:cation-translocating P-type ATPase [Thiosulfativibrio zosterae]BBP42529.1 calcium-translocating P-type ATPase, SERCA-type [Thiosulfativibrio zosterae]